jgi:sigma-E processing peptidase SpoIIGA
MQNLFYDYLVLSGVAILTDEKVHYPRLVGGLLTSLILSTLAFIYVPSLLTLVPLSTVFIVFGKKSRKKYLKSAIHYYCIGMFLGGVMNAMTAFVPLETAMLPYMLIALGTSLIVTLIYVLKSRWISEQDTISQFTHEVRIYCGGREIKGMGFVDTGNHLVDKKTSYPVMMIPKEMLDTHSIVEFLRRQRVNFWETTYSVINDDNQSLTVFKPTLLMINDEIVQNVVVGIVENSFVEYDFLLQPAIVKNI